MLLFEKQTSVTSHSGLFSKTEIEYGTLGLKRPSCQLPMLRSPHACQLSATESSESYDDDADLPPSSSHRRNLWLVCLARSGCSERVGASPGHAAPSTRLCCFQTDWPIHRSVCCSLVCSYTCGTCNDQFLVHIFVCMPLFLALPLTNHSGHLEPSIEHRTKGQVPRTLGVTRSNRPRPRCQVQRCAGNAAHGGCTMWTPLATA